MSTEHYKCKKEKDEIPRGPGNTADSKAVHSSAVHTTREESEFGKACESWFGEQKQRAKMIACTASPSLNHALLFHSCCAELLPLGWYSPGPGNKPSVGWISNSPDPLLSNSQSLTLFSCVPETASPLLPGKTRFIPQDPGWTSPPPRSLLQSSQAASSSPLVVPSSPLTVLSGLCLSFFKKFSFAGPWAPEGRITFYFFWFP